MNSSLTIGAFAIGATQLVKDLGLQGQWLKLVCVAAGAIATYMTIYQPMLWANLSGLLISAAATGGISLIHDLIEKRAGATQG